MRNGKLHAAILLLGFLMSAATLTFGRSSNLLVANDPGSNPPSLAGNGSAANIAYTVVKLSLGGGNTAVAAINNKSQVAGSSDTGVNGEHAFLYSDGIMTDLGTLGGAYSSAAALNSNGDVVGTSYLADNATQHAFLYHNGSMTDLGTLGGKNSFATGINSNGQIVGYSELLNGSCQYYANGGCHAFLYSNGKMIDLGTLGGNESRAIGISDTGWIAGNSFIAPGYAPSHAFLHNGTNIIDLGTICINGNCGHSSQANVINSSGQVAGWATLGKPPSVPGGESYHAFLYSSGTTDLGALGMDNSEALAISSSGAVAGYAYATGVARHAFVYNGGTIDLGASLAGDSEARGVNSSGQVVIASGGRAFLYSGGMISLNAVIDPSLGLQLQGGMFINDIGQIVAYGSGGINVPQMGYLLTPITANAPALNITKKHVGNFTQGDQNVTYALTVSNYPNAGPTHGTVTVTETVPPGLTLVSMTGTGWSCSANVCTRGDLLNGGLSYPAITVTVNVAAKATSPQVNRVSLSGGGFIPISATDSTVITPAQPPPDLTVRVTHPGNFAPGGTGSYAITVSNTGPVITNGMVTVVDTLPVGLTPIGISGSGWACTLRLNCQRNDPLAAGLSYPAITLTVSIASDAPASVINSVTVSGGGEVNTANNTATDSTTISQNVMATHFGTTDPTSEGFRFSVDAEPAATLGSNEDDLGLPEWSMIAPAFTTQTTYKTGALGAQQLTDAFKAGWKLTLQARAPSGNPGFHATTRLDIGTRRYDMGIGFSDNGTYIAYVVDHVYGPGNSALRMYQLPKAGYHLLELIYDPATSSANLSVDGAVQITNYTGHTDYLGNSGVVWGVVYGPGQGNFNLVKFEKMTPVTVATVATLTPIMNITSTTASGGGNVSSEGGAAVTARGICWSTSANPTLVDSHSSDGTGAGAFASYIAGLKPVTPYHVRAYATNPVGTAYGNDVTFTTLASVTTPTVTTNSPISNITSSMAAGGGNVTADGGAAVTARGVCWSTSANPTVSDSHTSDGTGTGAFASALTGLKSNTPYHVRAYAANSAGTAYGSDVTFTTLASATTPTVTTSTPISNITSTTASGGGNVTADGGAAVTARGVCWSIASNPTLADNHSSDGSGTGAFVSTITGLKPKAPYNVRAYATNAAGTAYGNNVTFTTVGQKADFLGSWSGQGTFSRNSDTGGWIYITTAVTQIAAGDMDGDGIDDVIGNWAGSGVWVQYSSTGQWGFLSSAADWIAVGDVNGDKKSDLVGIWSGTIYVRDSVSGNWTSIAAGASQVLAADLDNDGKADIIGIWPGDGTWVNYSSSGQWVRLSSAADWIALGDLNGDGKLDVLGIWGSEIWSCDGASGSWTKISTGASQLVTGDLDGDGKADVIGVWPGDGVWVVYSSSGKWEKLCSPADWIATGRMH